MKTVRLFLILCAVCCLAAEVGAAPRPVETISVKGIRYYRARAWGDANGLQPAWVVRDKTLQFANATANFQITSNSDRITFNGQIVALSHPVAFQNGAMYFSKLDVDTVLSPLLSPPRNTGPRVKTICLDPGHGGKDPGYRVGRKNEKTYTLLLAQEVRDVLVKEGFKVVLTRKRDTFMELPDRAAAANRAGADLFVSLHFNAFIQDKSVKGAETYCLTPAGASSSNAGGAGAGTGAYPGNANNSENIMLAYQLQRSLVRSASSQDRGVKRARFAVLRDAKIPAVLIETGFMSNAAESKRIFDAKSRKVFATAIADGIVAYRRSVER